MGVAMEASSTSYFLTEFISEFPVLVPVPSCKYRRGRSLFPAALSLQRERMWLESSPEPPPDSQLWNLPCRSFSSTQALFPLFPLGTVPACLSLCFETLEPSLYFVEKLAQEGFLPDPAAGEVESNLLHRDPPTETRFATLLLETGLALLWYCEEGICWPEQRNCNHSGGGLWLIAYCD